MLKQIGTLHLTQDEIVRELGKHARNTDVAAKPEPRRANLIVSTTDPDAAPALDKIQKLDTERGAEIERERAEARVREQREREAARKKQEAEAVAAEEARAAREAAAETARTAAASKR